MFGIRCPLLLRRKGSESGDPSLQDTREVILLACLTLLLLAPFAGKAFHIDDPLFIAMARQIRAHPFDPYGFDINWADRSMKAWWMIENPPLASYLIALASYVVGWSEAGLHLVFIAPAIAAVLGLFFLARRFCESPLQVSLAFLVTPVFLVSSTLLMCDVLMLSFWLWALVFWFKGEESKDLRFFVISGILIALATLTKYFGLALVPLLFLYSIARWRRIGWRVAVLLIPIATVIAWEFATRGAYGRGLFSDAVAYSRYFRTQVGAEAGSKLLIGLSFAGGCVAVALLYAPVLLGRRGLALGVGLAILVALSMTRVERIGTFSFRGAEGPLWGYIVQMSVMILGGLFIMFLAITDILRQRNAESLLLAVWVFGTLFFASILNWSVNGRSVLPMAPAVCILLVRFAEARYGGAFPIGSKRYLIPLFLSGALALTVTYADYTIANCARRGAQIACAVGGRGRTFWFEGHWGFHYYMEQAGARPVDVMKSVLNPTDVVAYPENASDLIPLPDDAVVVVRTVTCQPFKLLSTMHRDVGAGFFSDVWGPMPFAFGRVPAEKFNVLEISRLCEPPLSAEVRLSLGSKALVDKKIPEAIRHLTEAVRYDPDAANAHEMLGLALMLGGRLDDAIKEFQRALNIMPTLGGVHNNLAVAYIAKREYAKAWREVHLARKYGFEPPRELVEALSLFKSEPGK